MDIQYVIYGDRRRLSNKFLVRRFVVTSDKPVAEIESIGFVDTLEDARALVPVNCGFKKLHLPQDEPAIVEVWVKMTM